ncbi:AEC family transporter [Catenulispora yoronensis]|uniref:AEC family transporter n=1 Tax=Catenulispora yoronensis TaxID=450799 RepID=A0ABP5GS70_9ACTN
MLSAFIPIWLLTLLGYLIARFDLVGSQYAETTDVEGILGRFVFRIAMPAALFGMVAKSDLHALANTSIVAFGLSSLTACGLGLVMSTRIFRRGIGDGAVVGMASGYVNSANLGIPVAVQVLGNAGFLSTVILFNTVLVTPVALALMDLGNEAGTGQPNPESAAIAATAWRRRIRGIALLPVRNPIIIASALGALVAGTHWHIPVDVDHAASLLGGAAVPIALVTLGMSLHAGPKRTAIDETSQKFADNGDNQDNQTGHQSRVHGRQEIFEAAISTALKTAFQPALAYVLARYALHLHSYDVLAVTLCAALPTAQNVYIYAREYALDTAFARNAVVVSTLVSMAGLWTVVALLKK